LADEHAFRGELLDAVVKLVCYVDAAIGCHGDALRVVELSIFLAWRSPFGVVCIGEFISKPVALVDSGFWKQRNKLGYIGLHYFDITPYLVRLK
jgi:hypothetical protein